ncbi:MAG: hypothetical protein U0271_35860 [Polyangiaceae bacterium]
MKLSDAASNQAASPVRLRCLHGDALPAEVMRDAQRFAKLTDGALAAVGGILAPLVLEPMSKDLATSLSRLCVRYEVAEADLGHVLKVVRFLYKEAASSDLDKAGFESDLTTIWPEPRALGEAAIANFELIKRELRKTLLEEALMKHGNVLLDVDWRVDFVASDRQSSKLMLPLALVTLRYRDADRESRLTLQLLPEQLKRLEQMFGALSQRVLRPTGESKPAE